MDGIGQEASFPKPRKFRKAGLTANFRTANPQRTAVLAGISTSSSDYSTGLPSS